MSRNFGGRNYRNQNRNFGGRGGYGNQRKPNENPLRAGQCGLFFTVDGDDKRAVREAYNILGHYLAEMDEGPNNMEGQEQAESTAGDNKDQEDIADSLSKACHDLAAEQKEKRSVPAGWGHSQIVKVDTSAKNTLFFTSPAITPSNVYKYTDAIVNECQQTPRSRFLAKIMPVEEICSSQFDEFSTVLSNLITTHLKAFTKEDPAQKAPTYAVEFSHRNTDVIKRQEVIDLVTTIMHEHSPNSSVNLTSPDLLFVVQLIRRVALLSCVREFFSRRKFSVRPPVEKQEKMEGDIGKKAEENVKGNEEEEEDKDPEPDGEWD